MWATIGFLGVIFALVYMETSRHKSLVRIAELAAEAAKVEREGDSK